MLSKLERQTKIIWSFESSVLSPELVDQVATTHRAECVRLNYSPAYFDQAIGFIEQLRGREEASVAIMVDLASSVRARVKGLTAPRDLSYGETVFFTPEFSDNESLALSTGCWDELFAADASIFLGYGNVVLKVVEVDKDRIKAEVVQGGTIHPDVDVHIPQTRRKPSLPGVENHDLEQLLTAGVDFLVLPGGLSKAELIEFQNHVQTRVRHCPFLILKVDSVEIYQNLAEVLDVVDGVMISRRELALTTNPATIPMITKEIIQICNERAKLAVVASEMLASMRHNPTPTRAEVSDVANAVIDRTDAIVLSEEVSCGKYGLKAVEVMAKVIADVEGHVAARIPNWRKHRPKVVKEDDAVAYVAYRTAHRLQARAIVCITHAGNTPMRIASFGVPIPILAVTFSENILRRLLLIRGVSGVVLNSDPHLDEVLPIVNDLLKRESWLSEGDRIVFVSLTLSSVGREASNLITVQRLS